MPYAPRRPLQPVLIDPRILNGEPDFQDGFHWDDIREWTWDNGGLVGNTYNLTARPGWLRLHAVPPGKWWMGTQTGARLHRGSLERMGSGNFLVSTALETVISDNYHTAGLVIFQDVATYVAIYKHFSVIPFIIVADGAGAVYANVAYATNYVQLKIEKIANTYRFYYRANYTLPWNLLWTLTPVAFTAINWALTAFPFNAAALDADFDHFYMRKL